MVYLIETSFQIPEQVVLNFINCSVQFHKKCPIGIKGNSEQCISKSLEIIHYYTYFKFHQYSDHRSGLEKIKNIKEIDFVELITNKEIKVHTKKNQSIIPICEFTLKHKNKKWKIAEVQIKQGKNNYYSVFVN